MIDIRTKHVPAEARSKYFKNTGTVVVGGGGNSSSAGNGGLPFTLTADGYYKIHNWICVDGLQVGTTNEVIDVSTIEEWNQTSLLKHDHKNKSYLDIIDQSLCISSNPTFNSLGVVGDLTAKNIFSSNSLYIGTTKLNDYSGGGGIFVGGNISLSSGYTRSFNADASILEFNKWGRNAQRMIMTEDKIWFVGTKMNLDMNTEIGTRDENKNLNVFGDCTITGAFNCFELIANKVRSTNGMLYVTESANVKAMSPDKLVVEFDDYNMMLGDILLMQTFTGKNVKRKLIKLTYQSPVSGSENQFNYHVVDSSGNLIKPQNANSSLLPEVNDYFVKIDSDIEERRTGILLSPYDRGYIDFYTGSGNGIDKSVTTSLGNLDHLNKAGVSGYGLYSDNAHITGDIYAKNLTFDGLIDGNKINAESLVVKNLKTSETGVKIEASGHDLKMLDASNQIKLLVTGNKYNSINAFVNSSGAGGNYTITQKSLNGSCGSFVPGIAQTERNSAEMVPRFYVPATGSYKLIIPPMNISMYGHADNAFGTMHINIYLKNGDGDIVKLIKRDSMFVNENSLSSSVSSETMEVNLEGNRYYRIEVTSEFTANLNNAGIRGSVTINTTTKPVSQNYVVLMEMTNNTTIFENGLGYKASTTKYAVILNSNDASDPVFQARNGNTVFKIAPNGVYISDDAGINWRKL